MPAVGVAEVVAEGGGGADGCAIGGVDGAFASHLVSVSLDDIAVGQVVQGGDAPLAIASDSVPSRVAATDQDQRIDLASVNVLLHRSTGRDSRVVLGD